MHQIKWLTDSLQPELERLEKTINGETVTLYHWKKTVQHEEQWYVEVGLGGQIRPMHYSSFQQAKICYDSINPDIIKCARRIRKLWREMGDIRLSVHDAVTRAVFNDKPLAKTTKIKISNFYDDDS